jgi:hypothetical protein
MNSNYFIHAQISQVGPPLRFGLKVVRILTLGSSGDVTLCSLTDIETYCISLQNSLGSEDEGTTFFEFFIPPEHIFCGLFQGAVSI